MQTYKVNLLQLNQHGKPQYTPGVYITVHSNRISSINTTAPDADYTDLTPWLCLPGFIDLHTHLSQYRVRGRWAPDLLTWLNTYIFSEEQKAADDAYAKSTASGFFNQLLAAGTTTAIVYTAPKLNACQIAFEEAQKCGIRAYIGKTMMDYNCPDYLQEDTQQSVDEAVQLHQTWDNTDQRLHYIFTPRFAPVCTPKLMQLVADWANKLGAFVQTHLSENQNELQLVHQLYPNHLDYVHVYEDCGLLGPRTIMGHAIHLNQREIDILARTDTCIAHCPDSNFFLDSGAFAWQQVKQAGIRFGLGTDVAAGTSFSLLDTAKLAIYRQTGTRPNPAAVFASFTTDAARVLGKQTELGKLEPGYLADFVLLQTPDTTATDAETLMSELIFTGAHWPVKQVYINGKKVK